MAEIYPKIDPPSSGKSGDEGEKIVRHVLKKLPPNWVVIQDYWRFYVNKKREYENYEADFIVLIPYKGIVVIEVKNWHNCVVENGQWKYQRAGAANNELEPVDEYKQSPLNQAFLASSKLNGELSENVYANFRTDPKVEYRAMAIMIQNIATFANGVSGVEIDKQISEKTSIPLKDLYICGFKESDDEKLLKRKLEGLFVWSNSSFSRQFSSDRINLIVKYLLPRIYFNADPLYYGRVMENATASIHSLLQMVEKSSSDISVNGCAGSGKTWIAVRETIRLAKKYNGEKRILYVCFNKFLAAHIKNLPELCSYIKASTITVEHFHALCNSLSEKKYSLEDWKKKELYVFNDIRKNLTTDKKYDYIFVDEAQDFKSRWWNIIYELKAPDAKCYYFSDSNQNLFVKQKGNSLPPPPTRIDLIRNLRNSAEITKYSSALLPTDYQMEPLDLPGNKVIILDYKEDINERANQISLCLSSLAEGKWNKIKPEEDQNRVPVAKRQIVVLSPYAADKSPYVCSMLKVSQISHVANSKKKDLFDTWVEKRKEIVLGTTIRAFKGLEADYVILVDVDTPQNHPDSEFTENDFYVACTRAKYGLFIIPKSQKGEEFARAILRKAEGGRTEV